jgi:hypothetical protein
MSDTASVLRELPADATNAEALAWVGRMRRIVDRWETLPGHADRSMTPELKQCTHRELDDTEASIRRSMA